ncbi:phytochrome sensor protein [Opitutaceae bacterium EW11]|nr:phytochrome sensor protein [Opitutaceae bacterium EW11]
MKAAAATNSRLNGFLTLAGFVLVVTVLKLAAEVLVPLALTVLLAFLLSPGVVRLTRWGFPRVAAVILTVVIAFGVIGTVGWVVVSQGVSLLQKLPDYEGNIRTKISALKTPHGPDALSRATDMLKSLQHDMQAPAPTPSAPPAKSKDGNPPHPVPVEVKAPEHGPVDWLLQYMSPFVATLGTGAIVIVFVIALLFQREDMRDRFIKVVSAGRLNLATQALDDAARRVSRYLLMQLVVNATYGMPIGIGLYFIGVPNALLWGLLATLLRFIPFLGPWVAASFPVALAIAVDPGWTMLLYTVGLFLVMEVVSNNIVEPWLYGSSTGISNLALMVAAVFWTWLWGTPGLFLSTPLTVCIMVLGKYMPGLQFLSVLLGSEPVLEPSARFYQRMLSMDSDEMIALAEKWVDERGLDGFYRDIFVPALFMSEQDRHGGTLAEVRQRFIFDSSRELIAELERRPEKTDDANAEAPVSPRNPNPNLTSSSPLAMIVPARDDADEVVALVLRHLLKTLGIGAVVAPVSDHLENAIDQIQNEHIPIVVVSALPPAALVGARQLCRRIRESCPESRLIVGVWHYEANFSDLESRLRGPRPDAIVTSLPDAVHHISECLTTASDVGATPSADTPHPRTPESSSPNEEDVPAPLGLADREPDALFGTVSRDIAQHFGIPVSLVRITATDPEFWRTRSGVAPELASAPVPANGESRLPADQIVFVEDVTQDKRFSSDTSLAQRGIRFFGGVPLRTAAGRVVGAITVVDTKPRQIDERDRDFVQARANELMQAVEARHTAFTPVQGARTD